MARNGKAHKQAPVGVLAHSRLSPAEAHDIIRQRLGRMAGQWDLKAADIHRLTRRMQTVSYAPGEVILPRGVRGDCLGLVVRGQVAVHVGERGATRLVVLLLPGSTFGEMMLAQGHASNAGLQALTRCEIRFLRRANLTALRDERTSERQTATLWRLIGASALLLLAVLALMLTLLLPASREALAVVPMSIGQWCADWELDVCTSQAWQVAVNLAPGDPNPRLALGTFHWGRGDTESAAQAFEKARSLAPDLPEAYNNLGLIYAEQGKHDEAIAAFRRALELEPGIAATEHNLGASLQATHSYEEAVAHYQTSLALGGPQASTLLNMAIAYFEAGELDDAELLAHEALGMTPDLAPAHTVLGAVALEVEQPEIALSELQRAIDLDAGYGPAHFYLGLAYKTLNQPAEAIAAFEEALVHATDEVTRTRIRRHLNELYAE
ncbi:MAG: tetratricopeptide repeat protein [Anaerolineae bacterium]|nr:tetratricopeptide repeat protein [Anaerolineae bacterium]